MTCQVSDSATAPVLDGLLLCLAGASDGPAVANDDMRAMLQHHGAIVVDHPWDCHDLLLVDIAPGCVAQALRLLEAVTQDRSPALVFIAASADVTRLLHLAPGLPFDHVGRGCSPEWLLGTIRLALRRREREWEAGAEARRHAALFGQAPVAMLLTDPDDGDRVIEVNAAFETLTGFAAAEVTGRRGLLDHLLPEEQTRSLLRQVLDEGAGAREWEAQYRRRDGETGTLLLCADTLATETGRLHHHVMFDISARKRIEATLQESEDERRRLQAEMLQAQKMEGIGRMAAGIAHDFNNLLTVINGCSEILLQQLPGEDGARHLVQDIHKAGTRASTLISQLLAFSRKQLMQAESVNLNQLLQQFCAMLARMIGENIVLTLDCDAPRSQVRIDPIQFEQAVANLVINARDAMPGGGDLRITTTNVDISTRQGPPRMGLAPGHYVMVTVSDNGAGIPFEVQPHVFEPFFTTKEQGKGSGLGLATAYGIVKQSGGFIYFDSEPGSGTRFSIYLPARAPDAEVCPADAPDLAGEPQPHAPAHLLLVEDDDAVRAFASYALRRKGYHVQEAANARVGLQVHENDASRIGLVITDVVMPGMSGAELCKELRRRDPGIKVLFISGYTDDNSLPGELADGSIEFLQKPFSATELVARVRQLLEP